MGFSVHRIATSWFDEYRLIGRIWAGTFPQPGQKFPLSPLERSFMTILVFARSLSLVRIGQGFDSRMIRSAFSEAYVLLWLLFLSTLLRYPLSCASLMGVIVTYRIADAVTYRLCILFVDRYNQDWGLRSLNRTLILLLLNYLELAIGFAIIYLHFGAVGDGTGATLSEPGVAFYFSIITIATVGYGDLKPLNSLTQWFVVAEVLLGLVLVVLVVGAFLTGVREIRELPAETKGGKNTA